VDIFSIIFLVLSCLFFIYCLFFTEYFDPFIAYLLWPDPWAEIRSNKEVVVIPYLDPEFLEFLLSIYQFGPDECPNEEIGLKEETPPLIINQSTQIVLIAIGVLGISLQLYGIYIFWWL